MLSDLVGIPNLRQRSVEFVHNVAKRWILGLPVRPSGESRRVRCLLFFYGVSSSVYKVTLVLAICGMIAMKFYLLGLGLAIFFMVSVVGSALRRLLVFLWKSTETQPVRLRAVAVSLFVIVLIPAAISAVPVPGVVVVDGIVQTEDDRVVYAQSGGVLHDVALTAGQTVHQGKTLCRLTSNLADVELEKAGADVELRTLQVDPQLLRHGSRVAVRFSTSAEPYGAYLHRRVRQFVNKLRIK